MLNGLHVPAAAFRFYPAPLQGKSMGIVVLSFKLIKILFKLPIVIAGFIGSTIVFNGIGPLFPFPPPILIVVSIIAFYLVRSSGCTPEKIRGKNQLFLYTVFHLVSHFIIIEIIILSSTERIILLDGIYFFTIIQ
jgi:hypothetical protein